VGLSSARLMIPTRVFSHINDVGSLAWSHKGIVVRPSPTESWMVSVISLRTGSSNLCVAIGSVCVHGYEWGVCV